MEELMKLFAFQAGVGEMFIRGTTIYWALLLMLRVAGRRDVGSVGMADLLVLVLVADAAGTAMSGSSDSLLDGVVVIATIVGWSMVIDIVVYHVPFLHKFIEPGRVCLVRDGRIVPGGMRREHVTRRELMEQLRLKGVGSVSEVKRAYIESSGEFSVICFEEVTDDPQSTLEEDR